MLMLQWSTSKDEIVAITTFLTAFETKANLRMGAVYIVLCVTVVHRSHYFLPEGAGGGGGAN